jgi:hypothetical protein
MTIDWRSIPSWTLHQTNGLFLIKVNETSVKTYIGDSYRDRNVKIDLHYTENDRLVGYSVRSRKRKNLPRYLWGNFYGGIFYSQTKLPRKTLRKTAEMIYHDYNVRLIAFGDTPSIRDYLFVVRYKYDTEEGEDYE